MTGYLQSLPLSVKCTSLNFPAIVPAKHSQKVKGVQFFKDTMLCVCVCGTTPLSQSLQKRLLHGNQGPLFGRNFHRGFYENLAEYEEASKIALRSPAFGSHFAFSILPEIS